MRKMGMVAVAAAALLLLAGCDLFYGNDGADGKVYLNFTFSWTEATGFLASGFPTPVPFDGSVANRFSGTQGDTTTDEFLLTGALSGTGKWVLYDAYNASTAIPYLHVYFNDTHRYPIGGYIYNTSSSAVVTDILDYYVGQGNFGSYANSYSYAITRNKGTAGKIFWQDGTPGADKHFTVTFTWNPSNASISSRNLGAENTRTVEETDSYVIKELTDGDTTFRLKLGKPAAASKAKADTPANGKVEG